MRWYGEGSGVRVLVRTHLGARDEVASVGMHADGEFFTTLNVLFCAHLSKIGGSG